MTDPVMIVCPTHGRAGRVRTFKLIPDIPLCVAESQLPLYEEHYPDAEFIVHPDDVKGIAPKRQWLMDRYERVFMVDDDVDALLNMTAAPGDEMKVTDPQAVRDIVERAFDMAEEMGLFLVGFNSYQDPALFRPQNPLKLNGMVSGHAIGFRQGGRIFYPPDPSMLTDDLYISALNAHFHRINLQDLRYSFANVGTWTNEGGMAAHRTTQALVKNEEKMQGFFGDAIRRRTDTGRSSLKLEIQLTLKVPW